jgi:hypothetical protein
VRRDGFTLEMDFNPAACVSVIPAQARTHASLLTENVGSSRSRKLCVFHQFEIIITRIDC